MAGRRLCQRTHAAQLCRDSQPQPVRPAARRHTAAYGASAPRRCAPLVPPSPTTCLPRSPPPQTSKPKDFAGQIQLNMDHCWGTVRALVDMVLAMDDGKYLLLKDPNKDLLRLYAVPNDAFDANYADE